MGLRKPEVCDPLRSLQMSVARVCHAGRLPVFDMCREERRADQDLLPSAASTLRVPHVPQLIPLYPREAGCQIWGGGGHEGRGRQKQDKHRSFDTF